jgi:hypothetical protein
VIGSNTRGCRHEKYIKRDIRGRILRRQNIIGHGKNNGHKSTTDTKKSTNNIARTLENESRKAYLRIDCKKLDRNRNPVTPPSSAPESMIIVVSALDGFDRTCDVISAGEEMYMVHGEMTECMAALSVRTKCV